MFASTYIFAVILKTPVGVDHLTLRQKDKEPMRETYQELKSCASVLSYLQLLRLPSHFEQLCDGVDEPLEVMVTHLLDLSVVVPDPSVQLLHEEAMFLTVVHRPGEGKNVFTFFQNHLKPNIHLLSHSKAGIFQFLVHRMKVRNKSLLSADDKLQDKLTNISNLAREE